MKKSIIILIVIVIIIAAIAAGIFFVSKNGSTGTVTKPSTGSLPISGEGSPTQESSTGTVPATIPQGTTLIFGDATVPADEITTVLPSDAPQGATISFQDASGTITLNNFYTNAEGYWPALDTLLIQYNPSYTIWYYRDSSEFDIDIPFGGTMADADAGAAQLAGILGVNEQELCTLPVNAVFDLDQGITSESIPFDFCPQPVQ